MACYVAWGIPEGSLNGMGCGPAGGLSPTQSAGRALIVLLMGAAPGAGEIKQKCSFLATVNITQAQKLHF